MVSGFCSRCLLLGRKSLCGNLFEHSCFAKICMWQPFWTFKFRKDMFYFIVFMRWLYMIAEMDFYYKLLINVLVYFQILYLWAPEECVFCSLLKSFALKKNIFRSCNLALRIILIFVCYQKLEGWISTLLAKDRSSGTWHITIDFQKAYDHVGWPFVLSMLKALGFEPFFIRVVEAQSVEALACFSVC